MNGLYVKNDKISPIGYFRKPVDVAKLSDNPTFRMSPNGFQLTELEEALLLANGGKFYADDERADMVDWLGQSGDVREGVVMNHSFIIYRRAVDGEAYKQLWEMAQHNPTIHRVLQQKPRWGLDFSVEYIKPDGTMFEIIHWEYDTTDYGAIEELRERYQEKFLTTDWEAGAKYLLSKKHEWIDLGWFPQSKYKCDFFGLVPENFGQVLWK